MPDWGGPTRGTLSAPPKNQRRCRTYLFREVTMAWGRCWKQAAATGPQLCEDHMPQRGIAQPNNAGQVRSNARGALYVPYVLRYHGREGEGRLWQAPVVLLWVSGGGYVSAAGEVETRWAVVMGRDEEGGGCYVYNTRERRRLPERFADPQAAGTYIRGLAQAYAPTRAEEEAEALAEAEEGAAGDTLYEGDGADGPASG